MDYEPRFRSVRADAEHTEAGEATVEARMEYLGYVHMLQYSQTPNQAQEIVGQPSA